jgi:hypothetical protein
MSLRLDQRWNDYNGFLINPYYLYCYEFLSNNTKDEILYIEKILLDKTKKNQSKIFQSEYRNFTDDELLNFHNLILETLKEYDIKYKLHTNPIFHRSEYLTNTENIDRTSELENLKENPFKKFDKKKIVHKRGSKCSITGKLYENIIYDICNNIKMVNTKYNKFCTQNPSDLAGSSNKNDILCNFIKGKDIPIEIKKCKTPDWMQLSIVFKDGIWCSNGKNKIPDNAKTMIESIIKRNIIFNSKIPLFLEKDITHDEWKKIKKESNDFNDSYITCPEDTISKLYKSKGCYYIQISNFGLYHTGEDICNFDVPFFRCEQQLRIRTKIHSSCIKSGKYKGFMNASVTVAAQPKNINKLEKSQFSLDDFLKIPKNLIKI